MVLATAARLVMVVINVFMVLSSLIMIAIGMWMGTSLNSLMLVLGQTSVRSATGDLASNDVFRDIMGHSWFVRSCGIIMIVTGALIFFVAFLGCIGFLRKLPLLLFIYAALLGVLAIAKIGIIVVAIIGRSNMKGHLDAALHRGMENYLPHNQFNRTATESVQMGTTSLLNTMQISMQCCIMRDKSQLPDKVPWKTQAPSGYKIPAACCPLKPDEKQKVLSLGYRTMNTKLVKQDCPRTKNGWHEADCSETIAKFISYYLVPSIASISGLVVLEVIVIMLAIYSAFSSNDDGDAES